MRTIFICEQKGLWYAKIFNAKTRRTSINDSFKTKEEAEKKADLVRYILKKIELTCMNLSKERGLI